MEGTEPHRGTRLLERLEDGEQEPLIPPALPGLIVDHLHEPGGVALRKRHASPPPALGLMDEIAAAGKQVQVEVDERVGLVLVETTGQFLEIGDGAYMGSRRVKDPGELAQPLAVAWGVERHAEVGAGACIATGVALPC